MSKDSGQFTEESINYMKYTDLTYRKKLGQYFTPKSIREQLLSRLPKITSPKILDPSCGTGEFLISCDKLFNQAGLCGVEIDENLVNIAKHNTRGQILCKDALVLEAEPIYDFVVGNPPYFEFKPDSTIKRKFYEVINGRSNIFSMFIKLGLDFLKEGGYLAYVIPPSMNNGAYFNKLRTYIYNNSNIEYLSILKKEAIFNDVRQTVMLLILKKGKNHKDYIFKRNGIVIFSENYKLLREKYKNTVSLRDLGYRVKTGTIVWNQHKEKLTNDSKGTIPLIWSHNIQNNLLTLPFNQDKKPQYIHYPVYDTGPSIVVNRVTGLVSKAKLKAALIPDGMIYVGENHLNIIYKDNYNNNEYLFKINDKPKLSLERIHKQIISEDTINIMRNITGNTQISKTELELLLPLKV
ncbi:MAG: HsdM family class I SAM-dependent methyltransferase [Spirochaetota bacterium]